MPDDIRIQVVVPDGCEFVRYDADTGEAVYRKKEVSLELKRVARRDYHFVSAIDEVIHDYDISCLLDDRRRAVFNYYPTHALAERERLHELANRKLRHAARVLNPKGWTPDNEKEDRWQLMQQNNGIVVVRPVSRFQMRTSGTVYFQDEVAAQRALDWLTPEECAALFVLDYDVPRD